MTYLHGSTEYLDARDVHLSGPAEDGNAWYAAYFIPAITLIKDAAMRQPPQLQQAMAVFIADAHALAGPIATGNLERVDDLARMLKNMQTAINVWENADPSLFDVIEEVIRHIPQNLADAADAVQSGLTRVVEMVEAPLRKAGAGAAAAAAPLVLLGIAGAAAYYFFVKKPVKQPARSAA